MNYIVEKIDWGNGDIQKRAFVSFELFGHNVDFIKQAARDCEKVAFLSTEDPVYLIDGFKEHNLFDENWELIEERMAVGRLFVWEKKKDNNNEKFIFEVEKILKENRIKYLLISQDEDGGWLRFRVDSGIKNVGGFVDNVFITLEQWVKNLLKSLRLVVFDKAKNKVIIDSE